MCRLKACSVERTFSALYHNYNLYREKGECGIQRQNYHQAPLLCKNHTGNTAATVSGRVNNVSSVLRLCSVVPIMAVKVCGIFSRVILLYLFIFPSQYLNTDPISHTSNFPVPPSQLPSSLDSPQSHSVSLSLSLNPSLPVFLCSVSWKIGFKRPLLWTRASHTVGPVRFIFHTTEGEKIGAGERERHEEWRRIVLTSHWNQ